MPLIEHAEHQRLVKQASLGYEKRLAELRDENTALKARVAELEQQVASKAATVPVPPQQAAEPEPRGGRRRG